MSVDVFGHGVRNLPSLNPERYSDGPDRKRGPAKCRGVVGTCGEAGGVPHDHSCCCDPCRHHTVTDICQGYCCRCIPKFLCFAFVPDYPTDTCSAKSWRVAPEDALSKSTYGISTLNFGEVTVSVGLSETPGNGTQCVWRFKAPAFYVDEETAIVHSGAVHCQAPPEFIITGVNDVRYDVNGYASDCMGTLTISEYVEDKVPFVYKWTGTSETESVTCAACTDICTIICVRRGNINNAVYTRVEFQWDSISGRWLATDGSGHYITLVEENSVCYLRLDSIGTSVFTGDLVTVNPDECSLGMSLTASDEYTGDYIKISCNPCSCWQYLCGTCRCVCPDICVIGMEGGVLVEPFSLAWDFEKIRWGDDYFNVTPSRDEDGNCQATITGYADPIPMRNDCGSELSLLFAEDLETTLYNGFYNFLYVQCKGCATPCTAAGTCLDLCGDVPQILFAEVSASAWSLMLGCNDLVPCFATITIPLVQTFVPTVLNPAGEYRWQGCGIVACHDCNPLTANKNFLVCIDMGCDSEIVFNVRNATSTNTETFSYTLPCGESAVWDVQFETSSAFGDPLDGCCDEANFIVVITE